MLPLLVLVLTITLESLSDQPPEAGATEATEGRSLVIVDFEPMRNVDTKPPCSTSRCKFTGTGLDTMMLMELMVVVDGVCVCVRDYHI